MFAHTHDHTISPRLEYYTFTVPGYSEHKTGTENLGWGEDPYQGWYYMEKDIIERQAAGEDFEGKTGHYYPVIDKDITVTGVATVDGTGTTYGDGSLAVAEQSSAEVTPNGEKAFFTTDECREILNEYFTDFILKWNTTKDAYENAVSNDTAFIAADADLKSKREEKDRLKALVAKGGELEKAMTETQDAYDAYASVVTEKEGAYKAVANLPSEKESAYTSAKEELDRFIADASSYAEQKKTYETALAEKEEAESALKAKTAEAEEALALYTSLLDELQKAGADADEKTDRLAKAKAAYDDALKEAERLKALLDEMAAAADRTKANLSGLQAEETDKADAALKAETAYEEAAAAMDTAKADCEKTAETAGLIAEARAAYEKASSEEATAKETLDKASSEYDAKEKETAEKKTALENAKAIYEKALAINRDDAETFAEFGSVKEMVSATNEAENAVKTAKQALEECRKDAQALKEELADAIELYNNTKAAYDKAKADFEASRISVFNADVKVPESIYNGAEQKPVVEVVVGGRTLRFGEDYETEYSSNVNAGTASITVKGCGYYNGEANITFEIQARSLEGCGAELASKTYVYSGSTCTPSVTVKDGDKVLKEGTDYTVSYDSNVSVGTATVTVTGKGNYAGAVTKSFQIKAASGWVKEDGNWYYYNASGVKTTGWQKVGGVWYYMNSAGVMQTGWEKIGGRWYYFNSSGAMQTGWQKISGSWYYFNSSGSMGYSEWRDGYWLNANGTWTYQPRGSWKKSGGRWWFGDTSGWYAKNTTIWIDGSKYSFDASGWLK